MKASALPELLSWLAGCPVDPPAGGAAQPVFDTICTDSRLLEAGQVFLALSGERFDGHDFLTQALDRGAGLLIACADNSKTAELLQKGACRPIDPDNLQETFTEVVLADGVPVVLVEDTLAAYQKLAAGYRRTLQARVIAITGSVGKTSTREMVNCCLSEVLRTHQTKANFNNEIGLPATLLDTPADAEAVIVEMGMRGPGEIELLSRIAEPDLAMITNIGWSHIERLGSRENILRAKTEIVSGMKADGWIILNEDDPYLRQWRQDQKRTQKTAIVQIDSTLPPGYDGPALRASHIRYLNNRTQFTLQSAHGSWPVQLPLTGEHHVRNALFGLAAAMVLGIPMEKAIAGAARYQNTGHRQRYLRTARFHIIDDTYNAAPESMSAAIHAVAITAGANRKIAVFGCMLELGEYAPALHFEAGAAAARAGFSALYLIGEHAADIAQGANSIRPDLAVFQYVRQEDLIRDLQQALQRGDWILVKGSRAYQLEAVSAAITRLEEESEP